MLYDDVDISVAVSIPDGLITPIIRQRRPEGPRRHQQRDEGPGRARARRQAEAGGVPGRQLLDLQLGMYGVKHFAAIINPPQSAILAVGAGEQRPVVKDGQLAIATVMTCTLSVDHRVVDGALGAEWLAAFKRMIEDPLSLML